LKYGTEVGVLFDESRQATLTQTGHILPNQYLSITLVSGTDPDGRYGNSVGDRNSKGTD
jgi:hypothetical protein